LGFQGQSPQAARLIDALKAARTIGDPSFQGTIQADPTSGKERFYMQAKALVPKPDAAPARVAPAKTAAAVPAASASAPKPANASTTPAKPAPVQGKETADAHEAR
jgi:general secretion pathway protein L